MIEGKTARTVHAPGMMIVPVPPDTRSVSGQFGFPPGAYAGAQWTDGAEFLVYWFNGVNRTLLFKRTLRPHEEPSERGLQEYRLDLPSDPSGRGARLIFETAPLATPNFDWTCWTKPAFSP